MNVSSSRLSLAVASLLAASTASAESMSPHAELEEIVVTANPLRVGATDLVQAAVVLAGDDLARRISSSLGETLATQPGVTASFFGPRASRPIIRGLSGERVLMLQNGVSALDVSNLSPDHSVGIEEILADQVEVLKGPSTLLYGSGAVGGVVNVVDGRIPAARDEGWSGAAEVRGETADDELSGAARVDGQVGAVGLHAHGYLRETDDYDVPGYAWSRAARQEAIAEGEEPDLTRGTVPNSDSETEGGALGASWHGDGVTVGFAWGRHETNYGLPGPGEHHEEEEPEATPSGAAPLALDPGAEEAIRIDQEQDRYDFKAEWTELDGLLDQVLLRAAYNDYTHVELEGSEVGTRFDQEGIDARLHLGHRAIGGWEGTLGAQYTHSDLEAAGAEAYVPPSTTSAQSLFLVERKRYDLLTVDLGGRIELQEIDTEANLRDYDGTAYTLAGGLLWSFSNELTGAAQLTRSQRHPQAAELYADGPHLAVRRYEIGDDRLGRETATTLDLGLRSEGRLHWHVSAFWSDFDDYVYAAPTGQELDDLPVFVYVQEDAEFYGFEAELEFPLIETGDGGLHARVGGDWVRGKLSDGGNLPQIPPLRLLAGLEYDAGPLHAGLDVQWFDEQDDVATDETTTEGGTLLGAEVSYRWELGGPDVMVFLRGSNLLDEELRRHVSPLKDYAPLPGVSFLLGVRAGF
ncbi:MAG: TonB-dependent receptor [Lysobacterales bacterium]|nr:MAG: TonB-dependent receptor [Xanthomonadales bacterium]